MIDYFDNFLNEEELKDLFKIVDNISWKDIGGDIGDKIPYASNFTHTLINSKRGINPEEKILKTILKKIQDRYKCKYLPHSLYFNYSRFGDEVRVHTDRDTSNSLREVGNTVRKKNKTFMFYCTRRWHLNWYGETLFYSFDGTEVTGGSIPYPNRAVCFDSDIPHSPVPISRFCNEKRIVLVYQMEEK
jgi:hypothetical protein|tara:strand:- start:1111 stop:1674 length:564 start_codon:yes stop_codon:yes gene_type:complete